MISAHVDRVATKMAQLSQARDFAGAKTCKKELSMLDRHLRKLRQLVPKMEEHSQALRFDQAEAVLRNIQRSRKQLDKELAKHHKNSPATLAPYLQDPGLYPPPVAAAAQGATANTRSMSVATTNKKAKKKKARRRSGSSSGSSSSLGSGSDSSNSDSSNTDSKSGSGSSSRSGSCLLYTSPSPRDRG